MWVAKDKDGTLNLWAIEPNRANEYIWESCCCKIRLNPSLFPELKWEDEPLEVELVTKEELTSLKMLSALYREEHSENLWVSSEEERTCDNCKFKNDYPKCFSSNDTACEDWAERKKTK